MIWSHDVDFDRLSRQRMERIQQAMTGAGVDALLLITGSNVVYATSAWTMPADQEWTFHQRNVALVLRGDADPHLFTPYADDAPAHLPADHVHPPLWLESELGVEDLVARLDQVSGGAPLEVLAVDDLTVSMFLGLKKLLAPAKLVAANALINEARLIKTEDELALLRRIWAITEAASYAAERALKPGGRLSDLTGVYLESLFEHGATCNFLDPIWQPMPRRLADAPWTNNGAVPFALVTTDHIVSYGDIVWTDCVSGLHGYASDIGRTWYVGRPDARQRSLYERWRDVIAAVLETIRPGATGADMTRAAIAANDGEKPWLEHFFLGHSLGLGGGETQKIGSDMGPEYDEKFVLRPGMAIVLEPVVWHDGHGGYRCEELVFVTEHGYELVSSYPNEPFE